MPSNLSLGRLSVVIDANIDPFIMKMQKLSAMMSKSGFNKAMEKQMFSTAGATAQNTNALLKNIKALEKENRQLEKTYQGLIKLGIGFKVGTDGAVTAYRKMQYAAKQSFAGQLKAMLNFQAFAMKIIHYLTFSIGVQMVMAIRQGVTQMIDDIKEFEKALTNAATVSGHLGASFDDVVKHMAEVATTLGRETIFSANEVAKAYYNLASAGYEVTELGTKELLPFLNYAAATQTELEASTYAVSTTLKAFKLDIEDATRVVDVFTTAITNSFMTFEKMKEGMKYVAPIAGAMGAELEGTVASLALLVDRGMEGGQAGQRLNMIFTKLLKPTDKAREMMNSMGIAMSDIDPTTHDLVEILYRLQAAQFGAAEAATMFRARTAASAATLVDNVDEVARFRNQLMLTQGITESLAEKQIDTLWGALEKLGNRFQEAGLSLSEKLIPALKGGAEAMKNFTAVIEVGGPFIMNLISAVMKLAPALIGSYAALKLLAMILPQVGIGIYGIGTALKSTLLIMLPLTLILQHFAEGNKALQDIMLPLISVVTILGIAIKIKLLTAIKALIFNMPLLIADINIAIGKFISLTVSTIGYTTATTAATAATNALKVAIAATGIGLLIVGIGHLVAYFMDLYNAQESVSKQVALSDDTRMAIKDYSLSVKYINELTVDRIEQERKLRDLMVAGQEGTAQYAQEVEKLTLITNKLNDYRQTTLSQGTVLINILKKESEAVDESISAYLKKYELEEKISLIESKLVETTTKRDNALNDYTQSLAENGAMAESTTVAYSEYLKLGDDIITMEQDITKMLAEKSELVYMPEGATQREKELIKLGKELVETQTIILEQETQLMKLRSAQNAILAALYGWEKLLSEATRDLWEKKLKLLEAEEALYKIQKEVPTVLDEIFEALANEGMLNDEIISQYIEMQEAQAALLVERMEYFDAVSELGDEEQVALGNALGLYEDLINQNVDQETAWSIAFEGVDPSEFGIDLSDMGLEMPDIDWDILSGINMGFVEEYADALWDSVSATNALGDTLTPLLSNLEQAGVLTYDVVKQFHDWLEHIPALNNALEKVDEAVIELAKEYEDITGIMALLWRGVAEDNIDGSRNMVASWGAMLNKLGFLDNTTMSYYMTTQGLTTLLGRQVDSWDDITEAELIAASAVLTAADNEQIFIDKTSSINTLLSQMNGAPPFDDIENAALDAINQLGEVPTTLEAIDKMIATLTTSIGDKDSGLIGAVYDLIDAMSQVAYEAPDVDWTKPYEVDPHDLWGNLVRFWEDLPGRIGNIFSTGEPNYWTPNANARGGIHGLQRGIKETRGPQQAIIGEAGAEAVVPLEGANKKYGEKILKYILPKYFGIGMQTGGIAGGGIGIGNVGSEPADVANAMEDNSNLLDVLTAFSATNKKQLGELLEEFTVDQEDLEIDAGEFNKRIKDGTMSFKAIMMNVGTYTHATFESITNAFSSEIYNTGRDFFDLITSATGDFYDAIGTFYSAVSDLATRIDNITIDVTGGGNGDPDPDPDPDPVVNTVVGRGIITMAPDLHYGEVLSSSGEKRRVVETTTAERVQTFLDTHYPYGRPIPWAEGGIVKKPTFGMFGEAGAEALIPLERNRGIGARLLASIIPDYYPELMNQTGGVYSPTTRNVNTTSGDSYNEEYNVTGPISVVSPNPADFLKQLKEKYRASSRR